MWTEIRRAYGDSARVALALPLLFALPLIAELIQHVIEYRIGLFESFAAMEATGDHSARMGFGQIKILSLMLLPFWVARWHFRHDLSRRPILGDRASARLYVPVILLGVAIGLIQQFGGALLTPFVADPRTMMTIGIVFFLASLAVETYLVAWKVGAAIGNARMTITQSFRIMHGNFWWSLGYTLAMMLPLLIVHYALNALAVGRPDGLTWTILVLDSLVVGYLGLILATTSVLVARRAAQRGSAALAAA